jgi:hypothetical protein
MWTLDELRGHLENRKILWRKHALERMLERGISRAEVFDVLVRGDMIERYEADRPFPSALLGVSAEAPLHVVVALDEADSAIHIITAYRPDVAHFASDYRTRLKK